MARLLSVSALVCLLLLPSSPTLAFGPGGVKPPSGRISRGRRQLPGPSQPPVVDETAMASAVEGGVVEKEEEITSSRGRGKRPRPLLPPPSGAGQSKGLLPASTGQQGETGKSGGGMSYVRHTVDLYVPPKEMEVLMAWAERLEALTAKDESKLVRVDVKEQRLLALAQAYLWLEKKRMELAQGKPPGTVTVREVAMSIGLSAEEVQAFYKMGVRARSYILMSMHGTIIALANKYGAAFGIEKEELVQEGFKGAMAAVERYDHAKATAMGSTFRNFAQFYVMSSMIQAAKNEVRMGAPFEAKPKQPKLLPVGAVGQLPSSASVAEGRQGEGAEAEGEDEDEASVDEKKAPERRRKRAGSRVRKVYGYLPAEETMLDDKGAVLFGVDPELSRPAYEILDSRKREKDVAVFLDQAAREIPPMDMEVLSLVYGLNGERPMKRTQVARKLGLEPAVVNKTEKRAIKKLREMLQR